MIKLSFLHRLALSSLLFTGTILVLSPLVYALPEKQRRIIASGALYYDVNYECGTGEGNKGVYILGDSLTAGMEDDGELATKLDGKGWDPVTIQANPGFSVGDSIPKLEEDRNAIAESSAVVIGLGTNRGEDFEAELTELINKINEIASTTTIYWTNVYTAPGAFVDGGDAENDRINNIIETRSSEMGFQVIDWQAEATANPDQYPFLEDGVHHPPEGSLQKAQFIADSVGEPTSATIDSGAAVGNTGEGGPSAGESNIQKVTPAPFTGAPITPTGVVLHWTGGSPSQSVEGFISGISGRGLSVQLYIDGSGNVYQLVDDLATHTSHASGANSKTIGIEIAAGSGNSVETAEQEINSNETQKQAVATTVAYLVQQYNMEIDPNVSEYKGILSHHLVDPGRKSDVGDTYHQEIVDAVKSGGFSQLNHCAEQSGGEGGTPEENQRLGQQMASERGWTGGEWSCLLELWTRESSWDHTAINDAEGNNDLNGNSRLDVGEQISETEHDAYGIPQSLPGGKMATAGPDWRDSPRTQITWGLDYIGERYQTPCQAIEHHNANNWY